MEKRVLPASKSDSKDLNVAKGCTFKIMTA